MLIGWRLVRWLTAGWLAWACWTYWPAERFERDLAALPDYDYAAEFAQAMQSDALPRAAMIRDAGAEAGALSGAQVLAMSETLAARRGSAAFRLEQAGRGALTGVGETPEAIGGALVADLFVFGDVRDLAIQGHRWLSGESTDAVIVALSGLGLALTAAPHVDAGAAVLKLARRTGKLTARFSRSLVRLGRRAVGSGDYRRLGAVAVDTRRLVRGTDTATAVRLLRHMDHPADLALATRLVRAQRGGAFALDVGGRQSVRVMKSLGRQGDAVLVRAARKGRAGVRLLGDAGRVALRPHPLIGLAKAWRKGRAEQLVQAAVRECAGLMRWGASIWLAAEALLLGWLVARWRRRRMVRAQPAVG